VGTSNGRRGCRVRGITPHRRRVGSLPVHVSLQCRGRYSATEGELAPAVQLTRLCTSSGDAREESACLFHFFVTFY
jgi:hypothetical protein